MNELFDDKLRGTHFASRGFGVSLETPCRLGNFEIGKSEFIRKPNGNS